MSKRRPGAQLTQDNWDDEEEEVEAGTFTSADADTLKGRQIKKARRRGAGVNNGDSGGSASAFKGFSGFGGFGAATGEAKPTFSFNAKEPSKDETKPNGDDSKSCKSGDATEKKDRSAYLSQLKSLNESVMKWIQTHVQKNPYCILTPIFTDYGNHLAKIEKLDPEKNDGKISDEKTVKNGNTNSEKASVADSYHSLDTAKEQTPVPEKEKAAAAKPATGGFTFSGATSKLTEPTPSTSGFTISTGSGAAMSGGTGLFGAKLSTTSTFSFAAVNKPESSAGGASNEAESEDDEYVPPKAEVNEIIESDAFYSTRCKLFYKQGEAWKEKGIGNLHLKPCEAKTQLLIRADTSLGNILLNIMVHSSMPSSRMGKNNVMIVCVPNPPLDEKKPDDKTAVSWLLRVKGANEADELLAKINEAKLSAK